MDQNLLREIKASFRRAMNADLSNSMRKHGLSYKINFGVPSPRIKLIASEFEQNAENADYLWNEDVRESKMLATYLYPADQMSPETAQTWISQIRYTEIADQACMNLFVNLPFAGELATSSICSEEPMSQYTGLRLMVRILPKGADCDIDIASLLPYLRQALLSSHSYLSVAAIRLMEMLCEEEKNKASILTFFADWKNSDEGKLRNLYDTFIYEDEKE